MKKPLGETQRARDRANRLYKGGGYRSAYVNGAMAAIQGKPQDSNPYPYAPGAAGYFRAWQAGFISVTPEGQFD